MNSLTVLSRTLVTVSLLAMTLAACTRERYVPVPERVEVTVERTVSVPDELTTLVPAPPVPDPLTYGAMKTWTMDLISWALQYEEKLEQIANLPTDE